MSRADQHEGVACDDDDGGGVELRLSALGSGWIALEALREGSVFHRAELGAKDQRAFKAFAAEVASRARGRFDARQSQLEILKRIKRGVAALEESGEMAAADVDAEDRAAGVGRVVDDPDRLARIFLAAAPTPPSPDAGPPGRRLLQLGRAEVCREQGRRGPPDERYRSGSSCAHNKEQIAAAATAETKTRPPTARKVTTRLVGDVKQALASRVAIPASLGDPAWLADVEAIFPAREAIPFANARG